MNENTNIIRDYRIISKLGEGGMGTVYTANDAMLERKVAIKVLDPLLTGNEQFTSRFRQEAKVQASLIHPNIVALYNFFKEEQNYYMVMEYAEGETLKELIKRTGPIPEERALRIFGQMLEGVGYAHSKGIIHRDIKPSNIMVDGSDKVKIMDFGIAKILGDKGLTQTGMKLGTVMYMSPEQVRAEKDIDQRTDIYTLGITLYEMLTGRVPYNVNTNSDFEIMQEIVNKDIDYISNISENTNGMISFATAKNKHDRAKTCWEVSKFISKIDNPSKYNINNDISFILPCPNCNGLNRIWKSKFSNIDLAVCHFCESPLILKNRDYPGIILKCKNCGAESGIRRTHYNKLEYAHCKKCGNYLLEKETIQ